MHIIWETNTNKEKEQEQRREKKKKHGILTEHDDARNMLHADVL